MPRHHHKSHAHHSQHAEHMGHESKHGYAAGIGHDTHEGMMSSSHSEMSNCPREVIMKAYPKAYSPLPEDYDDTMRGVDRQISGDEAKMHKGFKPRKA